MALFNPKSILASLAGMLLLLLSACSAPVLNRSTPTPTLTPTLSFTSTVTPIPLVLSVNGQGLTAAEFNAAVARYQKARRPWARPSTRPRPPRRWVGT